MLSPLTDVSPLTEVSPLTDVSPLTEVSPLTDVSPLTEVSPGASFCPSVPSTGAAHDRASKGMEIRASVSIRVLEEMSRGFIRLPFNAPHMPS